MLMYIGGTQITPRATYAPPRTAEPPGTTRTFFSGGNFCSDWVCLSENGRPADMSTRSPNRKPSRMPCLTHVFTRHPVGVEPSGSADLTEPASSAAFNSYKAASAAALFAAAPAAARASTVDCRTNPQLLQERDDLFLRRRARRHHRQPVRVLAQSHRRHREFHRTGIRFHEVAQHQRHQPMVHLP